MMTENRKKKYGRVKKNRNAARNEFCLTINIQYNEKKRIGYSKKRDICAVISSINVLDDYYLCKILWLTSPIPLTWHNIGTIYKKSHPNQLKTHIQLNVQNKPPHCVIIKKIHFVRRKKRTV